MGVAGVLAIDRIVLVMVVGDDGLVVGGGGGNGRGADGGGHCCTGARTRTSGTQFLRPRSVCVRPESACFARRLPASLGLFSQILSVETIYCKRPQTVVTGEVAGKRV